MWLLSTRNLQLVYFNGPADVPGGYAILSHVWQAKEQSFQDITQLQTADEPEAQAHVSPDDDRLFDERFCPKIRGCVRTAREYGLDWVWIDTCCIDKTSSAELQEAINSMFRWYSESQVCFAYLADVPSSDWQRLDAEDSSFRRSRWFTRGWTLQELIAPQHLVFISAEWTYLGSKASLAQLMEDITRVDVEILTFHRELSEVSVARRMSWASTRQTTRLEDQAYSLLGVFGVTMPTIYGEGDVAFRRLQEEIMKHSSDRTLLVWGTYLTPLETDIVGSNDPMANLDPDIWLLFRKTWVHPLLARSPAAFSQSALIVPLSLSELLQSLNPFVEVLGSNIQDFYADVVTTGRGARCHWPIIQGKRISVALLPCANERGHCIGLLLSTSRSEPENPVYRISASGLVLRDMSNPRVLRRWIQANEHGRLVEIKTDLMRTLAYATTSTDSPLPLHELFLSPPTEKLDAHIKGIYIETRATKLYVFTSRSMRLASGLRIPTHALWHLARYGFHVKARRLSGQSVISLPLSLQERFLAIPFVHEPTGEAFFVVLIVTRGRNRLPPFLVDLVIFPFEPCLDWSPIASAYCAYGRRHYGPRGRRRWSGEGRNKVVTSESPWEGPLSGIRFGRGFAEWNGSRVCRMEAGDERRRVQGACIATVAGRDAILELSLGGSVFNALTASDATSSIAKHPAKECFEPQIKQGMRRHHNHSNARRSPAESEVEAAAFTTPFTVAGQRLQLQDWDENMITLQRPHSLIELFWIELSSLLQSTLLLPALWGATFKPIVARRSSRRSRSLDSRPHVFNPEGFYMQGSCDIISSVPSAMH
ncbi:HET-domain-containing protein [Trametes sanguinea]|nr:HET-domain-containing protein [Trametes sanguinea]